MNRRLQRTTHMVLITVLLFSHFFGFLSIPSTAIAAEPLEEGTILNSPTTTQQFDVITTINADWGLPIGDGNCQILWIPPVDQTIIEASNMRDFASRVVHDAYYWRHSDGAQVKFYQNVDYPDQVWINIAGSTVNYPGFGTFGVFNEDIHDLFENGESQDSIKSDYAVMVRKIIEYAVQNDILTNKRLMFSGHSQGGNVGQLVMLEIFLSDPELRQQYPQAWSNISLTITDEETNTEHTLHSSFPNELVDTSFGQIVNGTSTIDGGVIVASRPHWLIDKINDLKQSTPFATFLTESTDPVPGLFSPKTALEYGDWLDKVGVYTDGLIHLISLGMDLFFDKFGLTTSSANVGSRELAIDRSQIVFDDLTRANFRAHGQSYLDTTLVEGSNAKVIKGDLPAQASIAEYTPPNTVNGGTLRLRPLGGGGFDCRTAKVYTEEKGEDRPAWHVENCEYLYDNVKSEPVFAENRNSPIREPDGIPDTMWVDPDVLSGSEGTTLDPNYAQKQRSIVHYWSDTYGAPDTPDARHPFSDAKHDDLRQEPLEQRQRNLGEYGIFNPSFGIIYNREFVVNIIRENGEILAVEQIKPKDDCDDLDPDEPVGDSGDDDLGGTPPKYPNGHPDDYEAPWTFEEASAIPSWDLDTQYLNSIIPDEGLEAWGPAWSQAVVTALQPRIQQAQSLNLPAARAYYQYLQALINYQQNNEASTKILNTAELRSDYEAATTTLISLMSEMQAEWASGTRAGQPATADEIYDYWTAQITSNPAITTWQSHSETQAWQTAATPFLAARTAYMEQREAAGGMRPFQRQVYVERIKVERAMKGLVGIGLLKGGLERWTLATLTFAGITPQEVNPLRIAPGDAPPVVIVPTGALETYQQFEWSAAWFEQYVDQGGTLVVLAQAYGRDWELLPGGQVRGLGFEEDILCREASVDLITLQPYLTGIRKDRPDIQLDGSFTEYPANTTVVLKRRTGNLMPAMIEYPYGGGKVIATSLYPDFAVINGMQTGDDLAFSRSFFLYWLTEATGQTIGAQTEPNQPFTLPINLVNTTNAPLDKLVISTDANIEGPDNWRHRNNYNSLTKYPDLAQQLVNMPLNPALNPGEQRTLDVAMPGVGSPGYHRIAVNGIPDALYLVDSPVIYESSASMSVERDLDVYWNGDMATLTVNITPTETLQITTPIVIQEANGLLYNQFADLVPGQVTQRSYTFQVEQKHLQRPFKFVVREQSTNSVLGRSHFILPSDAPPSLSVQVSSTSTDQLAFAVRNIGVHGTAFSGTVWLRDRNSYMLHTETINGAVGHTERFDSVPTAQQFVMDLPGNQAAGRYTLSYLLEDQSGKLWRGAEVIDLSGLTADIATRTDLPIYDLTQAVTVSTAITPNMNMDDSWLHLTIEKPIEDLRFELLAGGLRGSDGQGRDAHFYDPHGIVMSHDGSFALVSDTRNQAIRYVDMNTGDVRTLAQGPIPNPNAYGSAPFIKDGIGSNVMFAFIKSIDISPDESYALFADGSLVRRLDLDTRRVTTVAGDPEREECWDGCYLGGGFADGFGTEALFEEISDIKISHDGTFALIADKYNYAIRRLDLQTYEVTTVVGGTSNNTYNDGIGRDAQLSSEVYIAITSDDQTAYILDKFAYTIRRVDLQTYQVTTIAGETGTSGSVDGIGSAARLYSPEFIDIDPSNRYLFFGEPYNELIRWLDLETLEVTTVIGAQTVNCSITDGIGTAARLCDFGGLSIARDTGRMGFVHNWQEHMVRHVDLNSLEVTTIAGEVGSLIDYNDGNGMDRFGIIGGVVLMPQEKKALMVGNQILWEVDVYTKQLTPLAGQSYRTNTSCQFADGVGTAARLCRPDGLAVSPDGTFALIGDNGNYRIRRYDVQTQELTTIAGDGTCTSSLVDGVGTQAQVCQITDIEISADGSFALFTDVGQYPRYVDTLRKLDLTTLEVTTIINDDTNPDLEHPQGLTISSDDQYAIVTRNGYNRYGFLHVDLNTYVTTRMTPTGDVEEFGYNESNIVYYPDDVEISADGNTAYFFDGYGLKEWDLISNTVHLISKDVTSNYGHLAVSADETRLFFTNQYGGQQEGDYGSALLMVESAIRLYDQWLPLNGADPQTITTPLLDPSLISDPRARGILLLEAQIYGPQRTDTFTNQRQLVSQAHSYFEVLPDTYTLTLMTEATDVPVGEMFEIRGVVRNLTGQTGVTLTISENGVALPDVVLPDLAPGALTSFVVPVTPSSPGFHLYRMAAPDGTLASVEVAVFAPGIDVGPLVGTPIVNAGSPAVFTTTITNASSLDGEVIIQLGSELPTTFVLTANSAISATLTLSVPTTVPAFWTVPVTISGALEDQRELFLEVHFPEPAVLELGEVLVGVPISGAVITNSLAARNLSYPIPNNPDSFIDIPLLVSEIGVVDDVNVQVSIAHSDTSDLRLELIAPHGQSVLLLYEYAASGANMTETVFDDQATQSIYGSSAPHTGTFYSYDQLSLLRGASLAGEWRLRVTDTDKDEYRGRVLDWKLITTPQAVDTSAPIVAGQPIRVLTTFQTTKRGTSVFRIEGLEDMAQQPLQIQSLEPVAVSTALTVTETLPGGEFPLNISVGRQTFQVPVEVRNWEADLAIDVPTASVQAGTLFTPSITITETVGISGTPTLYVRYGTTVVTEELMLAANGVYTVDVGLVADPGARRVSASLANIAAETDAPPFVALIDSRPINVHRFNASVSLDTLQATSGSTVTGRLEINGPVSYVRLQQPLALGGELLWLATGVSNTVVLHEQDQMIDLALTPTGTWEFAFAIPADLPSGRYALPFDIDGIEQPVMLDVVGSHITVHQSDLAGSSELLSITLDLASTTAISVTPRIFYRGSEISVLSAPEIWLAAGSQDVLLTTRIPTWLRGLGELQIVFSSVNGRALGGTQIQYQSQSIAILQADLVGPTIAEPVTISTTLLGAGPVTLTASTSAGTLITESLTLNGYLNHSFALLVPAGTSEVLLTVTDSAGEQATWPLNIGLLVDDSLDTVPPVVSLNPPSGSFATTWTTPVTVTGTASDNIALDKVQVGNTLAELDPTTGAFTAVVQLGPGIHLLRATAQDTGGNLAESSEVSVEVAFIPPTLNASAPLNVQEGEMLTLTVALNTPSALSGTIRISSTGGTAIPDEDYGAIDETIIFAVGQTTQTLTVSIPLDAVREDPETIIFSLSEPTNLDLTTTTLTVTINDQTVSTDHRLYLPLVRRTP